MARQARFAFVNRFTVKVTLDFLLSQLPIKGVHLNRLLHHPQQPNHLLRGIPSAVAHGLGVGLSIMGMITLIITAVVPAAQGVSLLSTICGTVLVLTFLLTG